MQFQHGCKIASISQLMKSVIIDNDVLDILMLCRKFELIPIKIEFFKVALKFGQRPCIIVQGISSKMARREFSIFIIFSDTYTCSYVV